MTRNRCRHAIAFLVTLAALSGSVLALAEAPSADRSLTLPSGATLKVATDWTVTELKDGLTLRDPEDELKIDVVEIDAGAGLPDTISAAWLRRRPGFNRQELVSSDSPGREGWDLSHRATYKTSPEESRIVSARAVKKGSQAVVLLLAGSRAAIQRRSQSSYWYTTQQPAPCRLRPRNLCGPTAAAVGRYAR